GSEYRRECHYFVQYVYVSVHVIASFPCIIRPLYRIISLPTASHVTLYVILLINHCTSVSVNLSLGISPDTSLISPSISTVSFFRTATPSSAYVVHKLNSHIVASILRHIV